MAWNYSVWRQYRNLLHSKVGDACAPTFSLFENWVFYLLQQLESGYEVSLTPSHQKYLTFTEYHTLHCMRVACCLYAERNRFFPWSLQDKTVEELRPLLSGDYLSVDEYPEDSFRYIFQEVWDINPTRRMFEAVFGWLLSAICGNPLRDECDVIVSLIQGMRDAGWAHVRGAYEDYEDYYNHSTFGVAYDYDDVASVKRGSCHLTSAYIVSTLRGFNIPAHVGLPWKPPGNKPSEWDEIRERRERFGHSFPHFSIPDVYLHHGDDVYDNTLETYSPSFAFRSPFWIVRYVEDAKSEYEWYRPTLFDMYFWWCILLGESSDLDYDVEYLYYTGQLRYKLEHIHEECELDQLNGAPNTIPPIFDDEMVNTLMNYVADKLPYLPYP